MSSSPSSSSIKSNGTSIADSLKVETSNDSVPPSSSTTTTTTTNTPLATKTTSDQASQIIALQATIQRLTKQLQKVKKHKNLAADLLDKRAVEHEEEIKIHEDKYMQLAKMHDKEVKQKGTDKVSEFLLRWLDDWTPTRYLHMHKTNTFKR